MIDILEYVESRGLQVIRDDGSELACYCPFHNNLDTPAFYINKKTGLWICFNPACGKTGSIRDLMLFFGDTGKIVRDYSIEDIESNLAFLKQDDEDDLSWEKTLEDIAVDYETESHKLQYLLDRSFSIDTLRYFGVAYSETKRRIVVPARDERHLVVGFIGRAIDSNVEPKYLYSKGFPRKDILFNLNNAKKFDSCIVVEGSLDAMRIHQCGFPNVVASLGASITKQHIDKLNRYFDKIIIFADNDHAGFSMRDIVIDNLYMKDLRIVIYEDPSVKDPGEMNAEQISSHIDNAVNFLTWRFDHVFSCTENQ